MTTPTTNQPVYRRGLTVMGGLLALLWVLEFVDQLTNNFLDQFGIKARQPSSLPEIFAAPFLHAGWGHLLANSLPFLLLGFLTYLSGRRVWIVTTLLSVVVSGLFAWLFSPPNTITLGASGLVFGWLVFLLVRGIFTRKLGQIALAVLVFLIYGSVLLGVFPTAAGVSWQAHLGGAVGGWLSAWWLHGRERASQRGRA